MHKNICGNENGAIEAPDMTTKETRLDYFIKYFLPSIVTVLTFTFGFYFTNKSIENQLELNSKLQTQSRLHDRELELLKFSINQNQTLINNIDKDLSDLFRNRIEIKIHTSIPKIFEFQTFKYHIGYQYISGNKSKIDAISKELKSIQSKHQFFVDMFDKYSAQADYLPGNNLREYGFWINVIDRLKLNRNKINKNTKYTDYLGMMIGRRNYDAPTPISNLVQVSDIKSKNCLIDSFLIEDIDRIPQDAYLNYEEAMYKNNIHDCDGYIGTFEAIQIYINFQDGLVEYLYNIRSQLMKKNLQGIEKQSLLNK